MRIFSIKIYCVIFPEIGCRHSADCPHQKACINSHCVDPCAYHQCAQQEQCHVDNHQPVCAHVGKYSEQFMTIETTFSFHWDNLFAGRDPYDCSHCSGGACDPITGACVKGNFDHLWSNILVISCFSSIHMQLFGKLKN